MKNTLILTVFSLFFSFGTLALDVEEPQEGSSKIFDKLTKEEAKTDEEKLQEIKEEEEAKTDDALPLFPPTGETEEDRIYGDDE